jgi:predicted HD phosphohydrolase
MIYTFSFLGRKKYIRADDAASARSTLIRAFSDTGDGGEVYASDALRAAFIECIGQYVPDHLGAHGYTQAASTSEYVEPRSTASRAHVSNHAKKVNAVRAINFLSLAN